MKILIKHEDSRIIWCVQRIINLSGSLSLSFCHFCFSSRGSLDRGRAINHQAQYNTMLFERYCTVLYCDLWSCYCCYNIIKWLPIWKGLFCVYNRLSYELMKLIQLSTCFGWELARGERPHWVTYRSLTIGLKRLSAFCFCPWRISWWVCRSRVWPGPRHSSWQKRVRWCHSFSNLRSSCLERCFPWGRKAFRRQWSGQCYHLMVSRFQL